jgi:hypothetical protein
MWGGLPSAQMRKLRCAWMLLLMVSATVARGDEPTAVPVDVTVRETAQLAPPSRMEELLAARVQRNGKDAASWRLLGSARLARQDWEGALAALERAVELDGRSAAALLDYGRALRHFERSGDAAAALRRVQELAPDTNYSRDAEAQLGELEQQAGIELVDYSIRSFDGSELIPQTVGPDPTFWDEVQDNFRVRLEMGSQYNSNVSLAPSSRELQNGDSDTPQGNASLLVQWYAVDRDGFRFGPSFDSDFTLNGDGFDRYNLQSYRPGLFAEGVWQAGGVDLKPRVAYNFTHDQFGGSTFGNRHTVSASLGTVWQPGETSTFYYALDNNNVAGDGTDPSVTSQDGWSNTLGVMHDHLRKDRVFRLFRLGGDYTYTNTVGSTYTFQGVSLYTQGVFIPATGWQLTVKGGYAYRDYFDFTQTPSRNTNILRASTELRKRFGGGFSTAIFAGYDRFLSQNDRYDTDRFQTGGVVTWEF